MGTPELARTVLRILGDEANGRWEIVLVVAQPDKPVGRGLELQPPPVKLEAQARGWPVAQPAKARDAAFLEHVQALAPDVLVVAAYGQILPPALLAVPRCGCLNVHTSLLPRWRGAAPIQWALLEGDAETGVTLMRMDAGLDTGDIVAMERTPILGTDTGQILHDRLAQIGGALLVRTLPDWLAGCVPAQPQPLEGVTYARKLTREDGRLDWSRSARSLALRIRAFNPWPGAFTDLVHAGGGSQLLKIWAADPVDERGPAGGILRAAGDDFVVAAGEGALRLREVQREGRRRMAAREFLAGQPAGMPGFRFGPVAGPASDESGPAAAP